MCSSDLRRAAKAKDLTARVSYNDDTKAMTFWTVPKIERKRTEDPATKDATTE